MERAQRRMLLDTADLTSSMARKMASKDLTYEELCQIEDKLAFIQQCVAQAKQNLKSE